MIDWVNMILYILTGLLICISVVLLTYWRRRNSNGQYFTIWEPTSSHINQGTSNDFICKVSEEVNTVRGIFLVLKE